jgi:putrescine aminotransferase
MTGPERRDVLETYQRHVSVGRARLGRMTGERIEVASSGSRVYGPDGEAYLDCGGYGVFILGHRHPKVSHAVVDQIYRHPLATRMLLEPRLAGAAKALAEVAPGGLEFAHFVCSGAEATEAAIKMARTCGKSSLICMSGGYHGKTLGALSVTAKNAYQEPFRPLLPGVRTVPFGDARALRDLLETCEDGCVILEPVQSEGGVILPPAGYLREVESLCRAHGAFLILDEIQTGLGRLGTWWGADREQVVPDALLVGKGLSGGVVPVAAVVASNEAYAAISRDPTLHSSTFAGSPLAMAAAHAAIEAIHEDAIIEKSSRLGELILSRLRALLEPLGDGVVRDVRGVGLLIGIEFTSAAQAAEFMLELLERGVIVNHSLNAGSVVRLTPPAVLDDDDLDFLFNVVERTVESLAARVLSAA